MLSDYTAHESSKCIKEEINAQAGQMSRLRIYLLLLHRIISMYIEILTLLICAALNHLKNFKVAATEAAVTRFPSPWRIFILVAYYW